MAETFYEASIGGVRLWIANLDTDGGRTLVQHQATRGDDVEVDDRGRGPHRTRVELLFAVMPNETSSPKDRFNAFRALVDKGNGEDGYYFTHPLEGTYRVAIGEFSYSLNNGVIRARAELIRKGVVEASIPLGPSVSPEAGLEAVTAAADSLTAALADADLESDLPSSATAAAERWADEAAPRSVFVEVATLTQEISDEIAALDLTSDLQLWPVYKTMIGLQYSLAQAAEAATAEVASVFSLLIERPTPLRAVVARIYGSAQAAERYEQVLKLNDLATPGRIPAGTTLILPARDPVPRRA